MQVILGRKKLTLYFLLLQQQHKRLNMNDNKIS